MNKLIALILIASIFVGGCAHTTPNPVPLAQVGDDTKNCDAIANEMQQMVNLKTQAAGDRNSQVGTNVALGIAGAFLIVPWFFMDVGNAATVEEKAAQARYLRLEQMQADRKCPPVPGLAQVKPIRDTSGNVTAYDVSATTPNAVANPSAVVEIASDKTRPQTTDVTISPAASNSSTSTPVQKLEALDAMLKKGLISQEEYEAKKGEILKTL